MSLVFNQPEYVLEDASDGTLLVSAPVGSERLCQGVHRISADTGNALSSCTGSPLDDPRQLVQSEDGNTLWFADNGGVGPDFIYEIDLGVSLASCSPVAIGGTFEDPWGPALHPDGDLIVAYQAAGLLRTLDPDTGAQTLINESPDIANPHHIAIVVPEPGAILSLASGIALLGYLHRRRAIPEDSVGRR